MRRELVIRPEAPINKSTSLPLKKFSSFFFNIQGPAPFLCWPRYFVLLSLVFSLLPSVVCSAATQSCRNEARSATDRLRKSSPPARLMEEYGNILATFDEADVLS